MIRTKDPYTATKAYRHEILTNFWKSQAKKNYMDNKIVVSLVPLVLLFPLFKYFVSFFICFSNAPLVMYVVRGLLSQNYA